MRRKATGAVDPGSRRRKRSPAGRGCTVSPRRRAGVDRDVVDKLWDRREQPARPRRRLATRRLQSGDDTLLFDYAATAGVRHPSFEDVVADYQARNGQSARRAMACSTPACSHSGNQRPVMPTWRWRVLHSPADAPRFMITDRGWMYVGMEDWPTHGLLLPMGPRVAILGYLDDPGLGPPGPRSRSTSICARARSTT